MYTDCLLYGVLGQILAAAAAAAHNRAARAAATSVKSVSSATESTTSVQPLLPLTVKHKPPSSSSSCTFQRRLPRRPRESQDKRFRCPFCELAYYHKKHLKYHLSKKHGFWVGGQLWSLTKCLITVISQVLSLLILICILLFCSFFNHVWHNADVPLGIVD